MLARIEVERYRSLQQVAIDLGDVTLVTGRNGSGKSNLYNALRLLQAGARGTLSETLLAEGRYAVRPVGRRQIGWPGPDAAQGPLR